MARLVRGMGHDNRLQMRLSAYVLATRLDQVVDAANERLVQLRDQRYLLQRTGRALRRTGQAGLGFLSGAMIAARWGYYRARQSNARLAAATAPAS